MAERGSNHLTERLLTLIVFIMSFGVASTVAIGALPGNMTSGTSNDFYCTADNDWRGSGTTRQDCKAAIELLYKAEVVNYGDEEFEFLSAKAKQRVEEYMRTPIRYTVGEFIDR